MLTQIEPNGNLTFLVDDSAEDVQTLLERHQGDDVAFLADMLDFFGFSPNARYRPISPENVGALTDAPMLSDDVDYTEDGVVVRGDVWWFPNYQVENFAETLAKEGRVTFTKASK